MDLIVSGNSLVNDGKTMRVAPAELTSAFRPHAFVEDAVRSADVVSGSEQHAHEPHVLLATTGQLPSTARMAMELHDAGAKVSLIAPNVHPARTLTLLEKCLTYRASAPRRCLEAALLRLQ